MSLFNSFLNITNSDKFEFSLGYLAKYPQNIKIKEKIPDGPHNVKIFTNKKNINYDDRDFSRRTIYALENVSIVYRIKPAGTLTLNGTIECNFRQYFGGAFYCRSYRWDPNGDFDKITGVEATVNFTNIKSSITTIDEMHRLMYKLSNMENFEKKITSFDEVFSLFQYYEELSNRINNDFNPYIESMSDPYYFIPYDVKNNTLETFEQIKDNDGITIGYYCDEVDIDYLPEEVRDAAKLVVDVTIFGDKDEYNKIVKNGLDTKSNLYLSNYDAITDSNYEFLKPFSLINFKFKEEKNHIILTGELPTKKDYNYEYKNLNVYDLGEKIKNSFIKRSLNAIKECSPGSNTDELVSYLLDKNELMPNINLNIPDWIINKYASELDEKQLLAFKKCIDGSPITLIKGPPGTGKTHVISALVQYITKEKKEKVIISSRTHVAIDNVLDKLINDKNPLIPCRITNRVNKYDRNHIDETIFRQWATDFNSHNEKATDDQLKAKMKESIAKFNGEKKFKYSSEMSMLEYSIVGVTTSNGSIESKKHNDFFKGYDWLIIDEVSKCPITEVLRYLPHVKKIIIVGDDYQLPPVLEIDSSEIRDLPIYNEQKFSDLKSMYENSVFADIKDKAEKSGRLVLLDKNYRSTEQILNIYNVFYDNQLIHSRSQNKKYQFVNQESGIKYEKNDVFFVEVLFGKELRSPSRSWYNNEESKATAFVLSDILKKLSNPSDKTLAVIFPYSAQRNIFVSENTEFINKAKNVFKNVEIDTIDAFQGREADIVLVNTVVTSEGRDHFLHDFRRINVAMSRAKEKLIIFGNSRTLKKIKMSAPNCDSKYFFDQIIDYIEKVNDGRILFKEGKIVNENKNQFNIE